MATDQTGASTKVKVSKSGYENKVLYDNIVLRL